MISEDSEWQRKGATLSDTSASKEFGLTPGDIIQAIRAGKLQHREGSMHGNPWLRLLRREVEELVVATYGAGHLKTLQAKAELARVNRELKQLKTQVAALERRRAQLLDDLQAT